MLTHSNTSTSMRNIQIYTRYLFFLLLDLKKEVVGPEFPGHFLNNVGHNSFRKKRKNYWEDSFHNGDNTIKCQLISIYSRSMQSMGSMKLNI